MKIVIILAVLLLAKAHGYSQGRGHHKSANFILELLQNAETDADNAMRPHPRFGNYKHFVRWDDKKFGGRYFECNAYALVGGDDYSSVKVVAHDGDAGTFSRKRVFPLGTPPNVGDKVIAYWDTRAYAFGGKVTAKGSGKWYVEFDDGDKGWIRKEWVHKKLPFNSYC